MRYMVKGGIWKNSEDEILKSAVMKYGLNQWSRISSLLVRKSAKECKARWYEWLDPSIKKTEWSRDEEEMLLHLSKIFPTMWRTIAQFIGRTTQQCIEKYERLLDVAQGRDPNDPNDARDRLAGEIDPNPETKPSRPDPIDMDEDEKEMLQECRARLANTKGKKATRKVREKKLEEARRLAQLQKQRELKQAGINVYRPIKIKGVDYNKEVPFMASVPEGRHKVGLEETPTIDTLKSNSALKQIETKLRDEEERRKRALDLKRLNKLKQKNLPKAIEKTNGANNMQLLQFNTRISLPQPTISESELSNIGKYASGTDQSFTVPNGKAKNQPASQILLGEYSQREILASVRQAQERTPLISERIRKGAQDALALRDSQTPLIGGQNPYLNIELVDMQTPILAKRTAAEAVHKSEFEVPAPKRAKLSKPLEAATPLRDQMRLNQEQAYTEAWEKSSIASGYTSVYGTNNQVRANIKASLNALPAPRNSTEMIAEDQIARLEADVQMYEQEEKSNADVSLASIDEEERLQKLRRIEEQQKAEEKLRMSSAMRKGLPRPTVIDPSMFDSEESLSRVQKMINEEMLVLMVHDNRTYPLKGMKASKLPTLQRQKVDYSSDQLNKARQMIAAQAEEIEQDQVWPEYIDQDTMYFQTSKKVDFKQLHPESEIVSSLQHTFSLRKKQIEREAKKCEKHVQAISSISLRYQEMARQSGKRLEELGQTRANQVIEKEVFETIRTLEQRNIVARQQVLQFELNQELERHRALQEKYQEVRDRQVRLLKEQQ